MEETLRYEGLIAACGMNCGVCIGFLREKKPCGGCFRSDEEDKPGVCRSCSIKNCELLAQRIVDLVFAAPPLLIISYQMIRRKNLGYLLGISLLLLLGALFLGLVPVLFVTAKLTGNPVNVTDIMIVSGSSMICMIPFILFARGITKASKSLQWKK